MDPGEARLEGMVAVVVLVAFGSFVTTLLGGLAALRVRDYRHLVLGLAAGLMLGVVGLDLIPEALKQQPSTVFGVPAPLLTFLLGFLVIHIIERAVGIHRGHESEYAGHSHAPAVGLLAAATRLECRPDGEPVHE